MVFGWAQIVMDLQPLFVMITGERHPHGFSHTDIGAILLAILSALIGKYLSEVGLNILGLNQEGPFILQSISGVAFISESIESQFRFKSRI